MTQELKALKAKLARRDKRIAALTQDNLAARRLLRDAIVSAGMLANENAAMKANAKVLTTDERTAKELEKLRHAEHALMLAKAATRYLTDVIETYEHKARKTLPYQFVLTGGTP